jgi:teichuronic acid biosynthesis glycosyltransferase TuaH
VHPVQVAVLSSTRWDSAWLSKQHLAVAWREAGHRVLYVDPPVSVLSPLRQPERVRDLVGRSRRTVRGVAVYTPRALPVQNSALVQRWNARLIQRGVQGSGLRPRVTVAFGLEARTALARSPGVRVYHCTDSWPDHPAADGPTVRERESQMIAGADVVVACSRPLVDALAERGTDARYVPHGVDVDAFSGAHPDPRLRSLDGPVIGYAGGINFRLDPELIEASLEAVDGTFVLIGAAWRSARGAVDERVTQLLAHPRVVTTGHLDGAALAAAISALDVGLVPYRESAFNRRSFPLKVPQYLAAGVPVVSTPNGATDEHAGHVAVASGADAFADAVRRASGDDDEDRREGRRRSASRRPWAVAAAELLEAAGVEPGAPGD